MWTPLPPGWENHRPGSAGATVGVRQDVIDDIYETCEGINFTKIDSLTDVQKGRLNRLANRRGTLTHCTHDLTRGVTLEELIGWDGPHGDGGNSLYSRPLFGLVTEPIELAGLRGVG